MSFQQLFEISLSDTGVSLRSFLPELTLCVTIVLLLASRLFRLTGKLSAFGLALLGSIIALYLATLPYRSTSLGIGDWQLSEWAASPAKGKELFTGLLIYDQFTVFFRSLLTFFAVLFVLLTGISGIPDREDGPDFYTLVLGGTLGMCLMASANHLLMVFLAVEMASVPSYVLAGLLKGRPKSSEAALKYAVYGAGAAGVMLYGISLLAGALGTAHLPTMARQLATVIQSGAAADVSTVLILGGLMVMVGLAFKLSAVPFHFWCPDVFEGASAEVNAFLSVASKAAALALLVRLVVGLGNAPDAPPRASVALVAAVSQGDHVDAGSDPAVQQALSWIARHPDPRSNAGLAPVRKYLLGLVALLAAITCTFGNLAAYGQTNIKRLLAYSTIAHAGYLMMPVAAAIALMGVNSAKAEDAIGAMCFYIGVYLFMNLAAFAAVAFLRNLIRSEEIADYAGLIRRWPGLVICFAMVLLSLLGLPPLAGFPAKVVIFSALIDAARSAPEFRTEMYGLLVLGGLNTVVSLFYYLRVVKVMILDPEPADRIPREFSLASAAGAYLVAVSAPVLVLGIWWDELNNLARAAASQFLA